MRLRRSARTDSHCPFHRRIALAAGLLVGILLVNAHAPGGHMSGSQAVPRAFLRASVEPQVYTVRSVGQPIKPCDWYSTHIPLKYRRALPSSFVSHRYFLHFVREFHCVAYQGVGNGSVLTFRFADTRTCSSERAGSHRRYSHKTQHATCRCYRPAD